MLHIVSTVLCFILFETFNVIGYYYCTSHGFYTGMTANKSYERNRRKDMSTCGAIHNTAPGIVYNSLDYSPIRINLASA